METPRDAVQAAPNTTIVVEGDGLLAWSGLSEGPAIVSEDEALLLVAVHAGDVVSDSPALGRLRAQGLLASTDWAPYPPFDDLGRPHMQSAPPIDPGRAGKLYLSSQTCLRLVGTGRFFAWAPSFPDDVGRENWLSMKLGRYFELSPAVARLMLRFLGGASVPDVLASLSPGEDDARTRQELGALVAEGVLGPARDRPPAHRTRWELAPIRPRVEVSAPSGPETVDSIERVSTGYGGFVTGLFLFLTYWLLVAPAGVLSRLSRRSRDEAMKRRQSGWQPAQTAGLARKSAYRDPF